MTIYEVLFTDGSSYILAADCMDDGDYSIRFFGEGNRYTSHPLIARFKKSGVRGWVIKGEMNKESSTIDGQNRNASSNSVV